MSLKTYMFDIGDSGHGPIGAVIEVRADSKPSALRKAKELAGDASEHPIIFQTAAGQARVYLNPGQIKSADGWREE